MSFIFAIETSCDETAMSLIESNGLIKTPRFRIVKNIIFSQINFHREFGGVVPNIAKREHIKALNEIIGKFETMPEFNKIEFIAVTTGPGLEPALWTGIEFAKKLSIKTNKPIFAANHIKGHLYSFLLSNPKNINNLFPMASLVVSGGHTILFILNNLTDSAQKIGETRDDAAGEVFDKGARLLGLPYPGGPELEKIALRGNQKYFNFPRPMINQKNYDFSFAGLKTALLYALKNNNKANWKDINKQIAFGITKNDLPSRVKSDIAASFEKAIIDCLVIKSFKAAENFKCRSIAISGGVSANKLLRKEFAREAKKRKIRFIAPDYQFSVDNAAMIAVSSYIERLQNVNRPLQAEGNLAT